MNSDDEKRLAEIRAEVARQGSRWSNTILPVKTLEWLFAKLDESERARRKALHERDEWADRITEERRQHDETRGYRQHVEAALAESERARKMADDLRAVLQGMWDEAAIAAGLPGQLLNGIEALKAALAGERAKREAAETKLRTDQRAAVIAWFDENKDASVKAIGDLNGVLEQERDAAVARAEAAEARVAELEARIEELTARQDIDLE